MTSYNSSRNLCSFGYYVPEKLSVRQAKHAAHLQVVVAAVSVVFQSQSGKGEEDVVARGNGH